MKKIVICGQKKLCADFIKVINRDKRFKIFVVSNTDGDWEANVPELCKDLNIKCFYGKINNYIDEIKIINPDAIFSIQARELFKKDVIDIPKCGTWNLHNGRLPEYAGCHPIPHAILNNEEHCYVTLHKMTPKFDEGFVIDEVKVDIEEKSAREIYDDMTIVGLNLLFGNLFSIIDEDYYFINRKDAISRYYKKDDIDFEEDSKICDISDLKKLKRQIQAFTFPPLQSATIELKEGKFSVLAVNEEGGLKILL